MFLCNGGLLQACACICGCSWRDNWNGFVQTYSFIFTVVSVLNEPSATLSLDSHTVYPCYPVPGQSHNPSTR
jgi:hypothetical protein